MIGVELRILGENLSNLEDGSAHLHTTRIVVTIRGVPMQLLNMLFYYNINISDTFHISTQLLIQYIIVKILRFYLV